MGKGQGSEAPPPAAAADGAGWAKAFDDTWDRGVADFVAWEDATARLLDAGLRSPLVLRPLGALITAVAKVEGRRRRALDVALGLAGIADGATQRRTFAMVQRTSLQVQELQMEIAALRQALVAAQQQTPRPAADAGGPAPGPAAPGRGARRRGAPEPDAG